jgi:hypothetical protein
VMRQFFGDLNSANGRLSSMKENVCPDKAQKELAVELIGTPEVA